MRKGEYSGSDRRTGAGLTPEERFKKDVDGVAVRLRRERPRSIYHLETREVGSERVKLLGTVADRRRKHISDEQMDERKRLLAELAAVEER